MNQFVIYGLIAAAVFASGAYSGHKVTANSYKADMLEVERAANERFKAESKKLNEVAAALEAAKNEKQIVYRTITKTVDRIIDRPVYLNVCLDDDGLRVINDALAGKTADPGKPDAAMPATKPAGR
jgi:hypothetical protein